MLVVSNGNAKTTEGRENSAYTRRILNTCHRYDKIVTTLDILESNRKGKFLNAFKEYHTYKAKKERIYISMKPIYKIIQYLK
jgi:hypothetical protein